MQQQHHVPVLTAPLAALCLFMHKTIAQGVLSDPADVTSSLPCNMQQQLQESGILQVLPEAFAAAAATMPWLAVQADGKDAATAAAAAAQAACSSTGSDQGNIGDTTSSSSSRSSSSKDSTEAGVADDAGSKQQHAEVLLCLLAAIPRLWPQMAAGPGSDETDNHLGRVACAGVQLVQAVMQAVSRRVQQAQQAEELQWQRSDERLLLYNLLLQAHTAMRSLLDSLYKAATESRSSRQHHTAAASAAGSCVLSTTRPNLEPLLLSPHYIQCLALMAAVLPYSSWPPLRKSGDSSTSSTMENSWYAPPSCYGPHPQPQDQSDQQGGASLGEMLCGSLAGTAAGTAWHQGSILKQTLTDHQQAMFTRLGTDSMTVSWAAASAADVPSTTSYSVGRQVGTQLLQAIADVLTCWKGQTTQQQQQQPTTIAGLLAAWPWLEVLVESSLLPPLLVCNSKTYSSRAHNPSHSKLLADAGDILAAVTAAGSSSGVAASSSGAAPAAAAGLRPAQSVLQLMRVAAVSDLESFVRVATEAAQSGQQWATENDEYSDTSDTIEAMANLCDPCANYAVGHCSEHGELLKWALAAGPGSPEQLQFCSLLASLMKFRFRFLDDSGEIKMVYAAQCAAVAETASKLLSLSCGVALSSCGNSSSSSSTPGLRISGVGQAGAAAGGSSAASSAANMPGIGRLSLSASAAASAGYPFLVLMGRCCIDWAADIGKDSTIDEILNRRVQVQIDGPQSLRYFPVDTTAQVICLGSDELSYVIDGGIIPPGERRLPHHLQVMRDWLQSDGPATALAAAGYDPQALVEQFDKVQAVTEAASSPTCLEAGPLKAAVRALRKLGRALCSFAVTPFCNNPSCSNVSGPTELSLVSGSRCMCGDCRVAHYCSRACQKQHWKTHKHVCRALQASAACRAAEAARLAAGSAAITQPSSAVAAQQQVIAAQHAQLLQQQDQIAELEVQLAADTAAAAAAQQEEAELRAQLQLLQSRSSLSARRAGRR